MISYLKVFFSRDDVNTKRQLNVDFAKCLAIIFMVFVHVFIYPLYKNVDTGLGYFIYAIGGSFLAAPVFMIAMGFGLAFTNSGSPNQIIKRGIKIFILSYIINAVRLFVPFIYYKLKFLIITIKHLVLENHAFKTIKNACFYVKLLKTKKMYNFFSIYDGTNSCISFYIERI